MAAVDGDESIGDWHAFAIVVVVVVVSIFVAVVLVASVTVAAVVHQRLEDARAYPQIALAVVVGEHVASSHGAMIVWLEHTEAGRVAVGQRLLKARESGEHLAGAHHKARRSAEVVQPHVLEHRAGAIAARRRRRRCRR